MLKFNQLGNYGRLGNQLFQIASTIGIAVYNNKEFAFPAWKYQHYFQHKIPYTDKEIRDTINENPDTGFKMPNIKDDKDYNLVGYFQSEMYFKHCENLIRHYFQFRHTYAKTSYCSVHLRLNDYIENKYIPLIKTDYYKKVMNYFQDDTEFLVSSDNLEKAREFFKDSDKFIRYNDCDNDMEAFIRMTQCSHHIIANSTFSWWAAWLCQNKDKIIFSPSKWFYTKDTENSIIPYQWIKVDTTTS